MTKRLFYSLVFLISLIPFVGATANAEGLVEFNTSGEWIDPNVEAYEPNFQIIEPQWDFSQNLVLDYASETPVVSTYEELKTEIYNGLQRFDTEFVVQYQSATPIDTTLLLDLFKEAIRIDHYNWKTVSRYGYRTEGYTTDAKITIIFDYLTTAEQEVMVNQKISELAASLVTPDMTDLEKVKAVNDFVVLNTTYAEDSIASKHSAYAVLFEQKGVCQGYALVALRLLEALGFEALYVEGDAGGPHGWNLVKLDGEWYQLDTTWNDPLPNKKAQVSYSYFLISDSMIEDTRTWERSEYPQAVDDKYNYFHDVVQAITVDEAIYFLHSVDTFLYKLTYHTGEMTKIASVRPMYLVNYDDWIYFSDYLYNGYLSRIKLDGTGIERVKTFHVKDLYIDNEVLYFVDKNDVQDSLILMETSPYFAEVRQLIEDLSIYTTKSQVKELEAKYNLLSNVEQSWILNKEKYISYLNAVTVAEEMDASINLLNEDSTSSDIITMKSLYDALTYLQKQFVENGDTLYEYEQLLASSEVSAQNVEQLFSSLVETNDKYKVQNARAFYDIQSKLTKSLVSNYHLLEQIEAYIRNANVVSATIENLVKTSTKEEINEARLAFEALNAMEQKFVDKVFWLEYLEENISNDQNSATIVSQKIATLSDNSTEEDVLVVRRAYDTLSENRKELVSNYDVLLGHEERIRIAHEVAENVEFLINELKEDSAEDEVTSVRKAYEQLSNLQKSYVKNLVTLTQLEQKFEKLRLVAKSIMDSISRLHVDSTELEIQTVRTAYNNLSENQKRYVSNLGDLEALEQAIIEDKEAAVLVESQINNLSVESTEAAITSVRVAYENLSNKQKEYVTNITKLTVLEQLLKENRQQANEVTEKIAKLTITSSEESIHSVRQALEALTYAQYKLVTNINQLQEMEQALNIDKALAGALDETILSLALTSTVDEVQNVFKAYEALTARQKTYVQQLNYLQSVQVLLNKADEEVEAIIQLISKLKSSSKTYLQEMMTIRERINQLHDTASKNITNLSQFIQLENTYADTLEAYIQIEALKTNPTIEEIQLARTAYNALPKAEQKYVTNLKDLTTAEGKVKAILNVVNLIEVIDPTGTKFFAQTNAAKQAYDKLKKEEQALVYNYSELVVYNQQAPVYNQISLLKDTSTKYIAEVEAAKTAYDTLSNKEYVTNVDKLENALEKIKAAKAVVVEIEELGKTTDPTIEAIQSARLAYNALPKAEQKYVTNLKGLTTAESKVKAILTVVNLIDVIDPTNAKFSIQLKSAVTAYNKLKEADKSLVFNYDYLVRMNAFVE